MSQIDNIVSWAGPVEHAVQKLRVATELLEAKDFATGLTALQEARNHIDQAAAFVSKLPRKKNV